MDNTKVTALDIKPIYLDFFFFFFFFLQFLQAMVKDYTV